MATFMEALTEGVRTVACAFYGTAGALNRAVWLLSTRGALVGDEFAPIVFELEYQRYCNRAPDYGDLPAGGFSGGQCRQPYVCYGTAIAQSNGAPVGWVSYSPLMGPLTPPLEPARLPGNPWLQLRDVNGNNGAGGWVTCHFYDGTPPNTAPTNPMRWEWIADGGSVEQVFSSQPDNCGDSPYKPIPPALAPGADTFPLPINYTDDNGNPKSNNYNLRIYAPIINFNNQLQIPFKLEVKPNVSVNGTINAKTGDINFNLGNPRSSDCNKSGNKARPTEQPENNPEQDKDDTPEEDPKLRKQLRGVLVTSSTVETESKTVVLDDELPWLYLPRLAQVSFLCRIGTDGAVSGWTEWSTVNLRRQLIQCPWEWGAVDVRVKWGTGVTGSITPIYTESDIPVESLTTEAP